MHVELIVPFRSDNGARERNWRWLEARWEIPVRAADVPTAAWVKGAATRAGLLASRAEIVVVADADCFCEGVEAAVAAADAGAPWAIPHGAVHRLTQASTTSFMEGAPFDGLELDQPPYRGYSGGGFVVARRELLLELPCDPRFIGWGQEDESWASALRTLAGDPWRGSVPLVHLWHPPAERMTRKFGSEENVALGRRYESARWNPAAMTQIISEAHDTFRTDHPTLHDHASQQRATNRLLRQ